jgi:hypothetical protein
MSQVTDEVDSAIARLDLRSQVRRLADVEAQRVNQEVLDEFVIGGVRRWWWETFRDPTASKSFPDGCAFEQLPEFVPDKTEECWFVVEDGDGDCYPVWEATPADAVRVVGECFAFEYYIVPKHKRWLICENHHDRVIGVGEQIVRAIRQVSTGI